jgi:hypothetical protein
MLTSICLFPFPGVKSYEARSEWKPEAKKQLLATVGGGVVLREVAKEGTNTVGFRAVPVLIDPEISIGSAGLGSFRPSIPSLATQSH